MQQQGHGGNEPDEICKEKEQEMVSKARVNDNQQLGEEKEIFFLGNQIQIQIQISKLGVGSSTKPGTENKTDPADGTRCFQFVCMMLLETPRYLLHFQSRRDS